MNFGYLAGFLDGEGCVRVEFHKSTNSYHPRITIGQKYPEVLLAIRAFLGLGTIVKQRRSWHLRISRFSDCAWVVKKLDRHVIVKRPQFELMKKFFKIDRSESNKAEQRGIYLALKAQNSGRRTPNQRSK